ncbi:tRNA lysidine(34) synthetase TilS [Caenimonas koreensis DSM 17982]|uniref:tRNA(Ile)-lysidine synthase n=1 Tax=Caenimonas koreensis DSM 17982 TaxID=1121255 RepID=A0A844B7I9_9BURK|nr:tRNA lysidine(34) synthetase TilS [Caenimonas koreensis]MRD47376.1 tRNA lysidine(34) synthetase TilS [Caenimonas koreensis DSM 17982]
MLQDAIARFTPSLPLAVALSGGADSTALLVACAEKWPQQVRAVHVHHGLQAAADDFERHCYILCKSLGVPLAVRHVDARHVPGESPEDAARRARYAAIAQAVRSDWAGEALHDVAVAQHADDQVETILLALSRGAGLPGLAAMPAHWQRDGLTWHRPLLDVPASEIRAWLRARNIEWVEDPTNRDERFVRNRIRARLLPALEQTFPQFRDTFARSARHAAQAQSLLAEVAQADLALVGSPPVIATLRGLSNPRQANVLRHWLRTAHDVAPSAAQLDELLAQVADCATRGHGIRIKVASGHVVRDGPLLRFAA